MYDLIVIGAGAGGLTCAYTARGFGKKVLLLDINLPGGTCTWTGCIPSKALINIANDIHVAKKYSYFDLDTSKIMEDVRGAIKTVYSHESPEVLEKDGIVFKKGESIKIGDNKTVVVDGIKFGTKHIVIATGTSPFIPPLLGLENIDFLTNKTLFQLEKLPKSMIILGGGAIGVEMAQALNRLGVKIALVESSQRILSRENEELSKILESVLEEEGVKIYSETAALSVEKGKDNIFLKVESRGKKFFIEGEKILISVGRTPNLKGLNLDNIGVKYTNSGLVTDSYLRTNIPNIYGVGDVVGPYQFSHMANYQGILAIKNMYLPIKKKVDYSNVTWCTFTSPELGSSGVSKVKRVDKKIYSYSREDSERTLTKLGDIFEMRVETNGKNEILEAKILANRGGELISSFQIAKTNKITLDKFALTTFPHPSYSEILGDLGKKAYTGKLLRNPIIKLFVK